MAKSLICIGLAVTVVASAAVAGACAQGVPAPAGDPAKGKALYMADGCSSCHGTAGQGGGGRTGGLRLSHVAMTFESFLGQLRHPANEMPPYVAAVLSDKDATDIYAFIASLPAPPDVKNIPLLND